MSETSTFGNTTGIFQLFNILKMMQEYGNKVKLLSDFEILNQVSFSLSYLKFVVVYSP